MTHSFKGDVMYILPRLDKGIIVAHTIVIEGAIIPSIKAGSKNDCECPVTSNWIFRYGLLGMDESRKHKKF